MAHRAPWALEFLAFTPGREAYGIAIQNVQEMRGYAAVMRIANPPKHIKGASACAASMRIEFKPGTLDEQMLRLTDIDKRISSSEPELIEKAAAPAH